MLALRHVAHAQGGVARVARKARLTREATYKMLSSPAIQNFGASARCSKQRDFGSQ
jgi:DNA-binding phage protein